jgi:hypothetical protein
MEKNMSKEQELFWRKTLDTLRAGPLPEVGLEPSQEETKAEIPKKELIGGFDPDSIGNFSKITMDVYFFMDQETHKYFMMQGQFMNDYGEMSLKKAMEMVKRRQKRNKG